MEKFKIFLSDNNITYLENELLSAHTSFKIGGAAKIFVEAKSIDELQLVLKFIEENQVKYFVIGKGSNLLVSDEGFDGCVIHLSGEFEKIELLDETTIKVGAGVPLITLCRFALEQSLSGLEFAFGIPGSVGGAIYMNAGAYGGQMSDVLLSSTHVSFNGALGQKIGDEMDLSYRHSAYSSTDDIIVSGIIKLEKGDREEINSKMLDLMGRRKDKQPLEYPSAGSTFKRPEGYFAGALIEQSNLKGYSVGGAQVSEKHAGFVINKGNATCEDVLNLIKHCQKVVKENFGVDLETEVKMI